MNVTFYCFNYYSLYVSYVYTLELKNKYNAKCNLIWRNTILELPNGAYEIWDEVIVLNLNEVKKAFIYKIFTKIRLSDFLIKMRINSKINKCKPKLKSKIFFVFKDNNIYDSTVINTIKKDGCENVVLIEEGTALYMNNRKEMSNYKDLLKKIIYSVVGLPKECFKNQGESHKIDIIICRNSKLLPQHKKEGKKIIEQSNLFTEKYANKFLKDIFNIDFNNRKMDIVYVSQPLSEGGFINESDEKRAILTIMQKIETKYNVGIKLHPRENKTKYDEIIQKFSNVNLIEDVLQKIPAELLLYIYNQPTIITPFSSVATNVKNINNRTDIALTYKFYNLKKELENELDIIFDSYKSEIIEKNSNFIKIKLREINNSNNKVELNEIENILDKSVE